MRCLAGRDCLIRRGVGDEFLASVAETEHAIVLHAPMSSPVSIGKILSVWRTIYFSNWYVL